MAAPTDACKGGLPCPDLGGNISTDKRELSIRMASDIEAAWGRRLDVNNVLLPRGGPIMSR